MEKVLVLGGNHFFGKKLVRILLNQNYDVTLLNRGSKNDGFGDAVSRIVCDRTDADLLKLAINDHYDYVFDQCCFDYNQAKLASEVFNGRVKKYIFTSSVSAYCEYGSAIKESMLDPAKHSIEKLQTTESNYGDAKRQAEVAFSRYAKFPVVCARFPIVLDKEDATERLEFHIKKIQNNEEIFFPDLNAKISFISADEAARALLKLAESAFQGSVNVASYDPITLKEFVEFIELKYDKRLVKAVKQTDSNSSPYGIHKDWFMNCELLKSLGITIESIEDYLPKII